MMGPSFLGLYGAWGISFGALFPIVQDLTQVPKRKLQGIHESKLLVIID